MSNCRSDFGFLAMRGPFKKTHAVIVEISGLKREMRLGASKQLSSSSASVMSRSAPAIVSASFASDWRASMSRVFGEVLLERTRLNAARSLLDNKSLSCSNVLARFAHFLIHCCCAFDRRRDRRQDVLHPLSHNMDTYQEEGNLAHLCARRATLPSVLLSYPL